MLKNSYWGPLLGTFLVGTILDIVFEVSSPNLYHMLLIPISIILVGFCMFCSWNSVRARQWLRATLFGTSTLVFLGTAVFYCTSSNVLSAYLKGTATRAFVMEREVANIRSERIPASDEVVYWVVIKNDDRVFKFVDSVYTYASSVIVPGDTISFEYAEPSSPRSTERSAKNLIRGKLPPTARGL